MSNLRFDGKVAVITGAGAGLGRAYALLFASRGAKVVVNDLGGDPHGRGSGQKAADVVVNEIKQAGGTAVANYDSVTEGSKIIKTALDNYGRVDILVNNAGILRDKSFANLTEDDWDIIQSVHLKGSFKTTQAAFPVMKKQGYGRIIMTSSGSGLYGNFGQANYSAAKMGVVGLANTLAIEGAAKNVYCNVIVPTAGSRLTQGLLPEDLYQELKPELIAPVVAYLCHDSCQENGTIIESAAGWAGKSQICRSKGGLIRQRITDPATIENVEAKWPEITDMKNAVPRVSLSASLADLAEKLEHLRQGEEPPTSSREGDIFTFSSKDLILYALGVGASVQNPEELKLLYENHENFGSIPSFYILPSLQAVMSSSQLNTIPGKSISLENMLHGEQYLEIYNSTPEAGTLLSNPKIVETLDKGSGAAIVTEINSYNEQGALIMRNQCVTFAVGAGNFGGPRTGNKIVPCVPKPDRKPDLSLSYKTTIDQAALYRLSGDINPMHIDPNFSAIAGYEKPILHGLCTLGISVRLVMGAFASYDRKLFRAVKARFTKVVIPGQTLRVDMWRNGNRIHFETIVVENGTAAITGAYVDLKAIKTGIMQNKLAASTLKSDAVFEYINDQVKVQPDKAKSVNGIFLVKITKDGEIVKEWTMDLKSASIYEGAGKDVKPNTTLVVSDDDFVELAVGKLNPQQAFMKGKLKVTGNIMLAQKLGPLLKAAPKL
ncbi:peroxisomal multifunctional enzyme type 2-like [Photinus pyralis]|uniref:Peroxisomal multifunctional enzyme type 2 n=2 Tax=Photinus pyralis TaxID=7054 RepID=A0A1Y1MAJ1_PHOPY|nr:peroxisomal multifunctional enzyme type 2-like [Photinus pyralis]